jgi:tryptophanase
MLTRLAQRPAKIDSQMPVEVEVRMIAISRKVYGVQHIGYRCCVNAAIKRHADANLHRLETA